MSCGHKRCETLGHCGLASLRKTNRKLTDGRLLNLIDTSGFEFGPIRMLALYSQSYERIPAEYPYEGKRYR